MGAWGTRSPNGTALFLHKRRSWSKREATDVTTVLDPQQLLYSYQTLKLPLSYLGHSKGALHSGFPLTMHSISVSQRMVCSYFSDCMQTIWGGETGVYLNVANGLASTLSDERETTHLNFNPLLAGLCQKECTSKIQGAKLSISLIWGLTVGELPCPKHTPAVDCELTSWQSDLLSPLKGSGQHNL